jgi:tight adherence protein C
MILLLAAAACFAGAVVVGLAQLTGNRGATASLARVAAYGRPVETAVETTGPRIVPFVGALARVGLRLAPGRDRVKTAAQLHAAGYPAVRPESFVALKMGAGLGGALLGLAAGAATGAAGAILLAAAAGGIGFLAPDVFLGSRARRRREQILAELPNALDLLAVIVEAGLGLDAALARYAERADGPLAQELALLVTEMRVGGSRAETLKRLAERVPAPETKSFVRAILQADQMGVSLSGTLRGQARDVRVRRQAVAEERANKAPVKMLFPVVLCIFPILFVIVLGPAILSLMTAL